MALSRVPSAELRWRLDPEKLNDDEQPLPIGHECLDALTDALTLAAHSPPARFASIFVRGQPGTQRQALLRQAASQARLPENSLPDCCFVHNFEKPEQPRLILLPAGQGRQLRADIQEISGFIRDQLEGALQSRPIRNRLQALTDRSDTEMRRITAPLEKKLKPHGLVLVREEVGQLVRLTVHVQQTGRVITQEDLGNLVAKGQISAEEFKHIRKVSRESQQQLADITLQVNQVWKHSQQLANRMLRAETRRLLANLAQPLLERFDHPEIHKHVDAIIDDVLEKRVGRPTTHLADPELLYSVNLVFAADLDGPPLVFEDHPTPRNLGGTVDPSWLEGNRSIASFRGIRAGSLVAAGGGFLVLDAETLLDHPDSINLLRRTLVSEHASIEAPAVLSNSPAVTLRPDPIPLAARLVLVGTGSNWTALHARFPGFMRLFGVPVDVPDSIPRDRKNASRMARHLEGECAALGISPVSKEALSALVEQAARLGGAGRLSTCVDALVNVAQHAAVLARAAGESGISATRIHAACERDRLWPRSANRPVESTVVNFPLRQHLPGQIFIAAAETDGNFPCGRLIRIQASAAHADSAEFFFDSAARDHARGLQPQIEALLTQLLHLDQPIRVRAVFRCIDAYGQDAFVDTPGTEKSESLLFGAVVALLSHLSGLPLRQDMAVSADLAADGKMLPVAYINERVEDVFRFTQQYRGDTEAGIVIPGLQRDALMLAPRVIQAAVNDLFQIYSSGHLVQALELLTGASPGVWRDQGFQPGTLFQRARARLSRDRATANAG